MHLHSVLCKMILHNAGINKSKTLTYWFLFLLLKIVCAYNLKPGWEFSLPSKHKVISSIQSTKNNKNKKENLWGKCKTELCLHWKWSHLIEFPIVKQNKSHTYSTNYIKFLLPVPSPISLSDICLISSSVDNLFWYVYTQKIRF